MATYLIVTSGRHSGQKIALPRTQFVIGRDASCHLRPISTDVSKFHCAVAHQGERIVVRDLRSTNGTFLNGQRVTGTTKARHGDVLKIGPLEFMFHVVTESEATSGGTDSQLDWLMRVPTEGESQVLDPGQDTSIIEILPMGTLEELRKAVSAAKQGQGYSREATAVAGRFMREYMATRKRSTKKQRGDRGPNS